MHFKVKKNLTNLRNKFCEFQPWWLDCIFCAFGICVHKTFKLNVGEIDPWYQLPFAFFRFAFAFPLTLLQQANNKRKLAIQQAKSFVRLRLQLQCWFGTIFFLIMYSYNLLFNLIWQYLLWEVKIFQSYDVLW